jgi:hypothetical protein
MAKAKSSLLDEVIATASSVFQGTMPWYRKLKPEHQSEVMALKSAWKSGAITHPLRTYARAIAKHLRERGIASIGEQGVQRWLQND